jgi:hypothetical protein
MMHLYACIFNNMPSLAVLNMSGSWLYQVPWGAMQWPNGPVLLYHQSI